MTDRMRIDNAELPSIDVTLDEATELDGQHTRTVIIRQGSNTVWIDAGSVLELAEVAGTAAAESAET